jgi:ATP-dependent RNA helicase DeaD
VTPKEYILLKQIEKFTKSKIKRKEIPTVDDIFEAKYKNIEKKIKDVLSEDNYKNFVPVATELDEEYNLVDVAAALMKIIFDKELSFNYKENSINVEEENMRLFFSIGRMDSITPRKLLKFITETSSIEAYEIGDIDILNKFTFISVPERVGNVILKKSNGKRLQGRRVSVELAKSKKSHH